MHTKKLIDALQRILDGDITPYVGICGNIREDVCIDLFQQLALQWPYHSGMVVYPIPKLGDEDTACTAYHTCGRKKTFWDGPYGVLRTDLCAFIHTLLTDPDFDPKQWHSEAVTSILTSTEPLCLS